MRFRTCASRVSGASQLGIRCGKRSSHSICLLVLALFLTFTLAASAQNAQISLPAAGIINTLAGNGTKSNTGDNGPATSAQLYYPDGVAVDANGNIFIADTYNNRIREVNFSTGLISTIAGSGASGPANAGYSPDGTLATSALLNQPQGVAVDSSGNVYIADTANHVVREVMATTNGSMIAGNIYTIAGNHTGNFSGDGGPAINAALDYPVGITLDSSGNLYIADTHNNRVREVTTSTGIINTIAGSGTKGYSGDGGAPKSAALSFPMAVAIDSLGDVYIADYNNNVIREVMAVTNGSLLAGNIYTVVGGGTVCSQASDSVGDGCSPTAATLLNPSGVAVDGFGSIFIADSGNFRIRAAMATTAGAYQAGNIYTVAGTGIANYSGDGGSATSAAINMPAGGLALDSARNIYIADVKNSRIRAIGATLLTQTITFPPINGGSPVIYGASPITLSATGGGSNNPIVFSVVSGPGTISGNTLIVSGAGTITVEADQAGNTFYAAASPVQQNLSVSPAPLTIKANDATRNYRAANPTFAASYTGLVNGDSAASLSGAPGFTTTATTSSHPGSYPITPNVGTISNTNYTYTLVSGTLTVTQLPLTVYWSTPSAITYGTPLTSTGTPAQLNANDGGVATSAITYTPAAGACPTGSSAYPLSVEMDPSDTVDYAPGYKTVYLVVNTATPSVSAPTASTSSPTYNNPLTLSVTLSGVTNSSCSGAMPTGTVTFYDGSTTLGTQPVSGGAASITVNTLLVGTHTIKATYNGDSNYKSANSPTSQATIGLASGELAQAIVSTSNPHSIPADFLGISIDWTVPTSVMERNGIVNTEYQQLVKNIDNYLSKPILLRVETDSNDCKWHNECISPIMIQNDLAPLASLAKAVNVNYVLGVDLSEGNLGNAQAEAGYWLNNTIPTADIQAIEIGNEPDNYANETFANYLSSLQTWESGISNLPVPAFMAPSFARSIWEFCSPTVTECELQQLNADSTGASNGQNNTTFTMPLPSKPAVKTIISQHAYFGQADAQAVTDGTFLLQPNQATKWPNDFASLALAAQHAGLKFRMGETNSTAPATPGVSNAFSSALWSMDEMFNFLNKGIDGVNWHSTYNSDYDLFETSFNGSSFTLQKVNPLYYGLWVFAQVAGGKNGLLLPVTTTSNSNISIWATSIYPNSTPTTKTMNVVVINKDTAATGDVFIDLPGYTMGTVNYLTAPAYNQVPNCPVNSTTCTTSITYGGTSFQTFDGSTDGNPVGTLTGIAINGTQQLDGTYLFKVPGMATATAAVITFTN